MDTQGRLAPLRRGEPVLSNHRDRSLSEQPYMGLQSQLAPPRTGKLLALLKPSTLSLFPLTLLRVRHYFNQIVFKVTDVSS